MKLGRVAIFLVIVISAVVVLNYLIRTSPGSDGASPSSAEDSAAHAGHTHATSPAPPTPPTQITNTQGKTVAVPPFSFREESTNVSELAKGYPRTRAELVKIATGEDFFKAQSIPVVPHSPHEITQRQMGAVKVMALRELMKRESNTLQLSQNLDTIIATAKDPTIKEIAKAAKASLEKGRPFFEDFLDGIANLEMD